MATHDHIERMIYEILGAEEGARVLGELAEAEAQHTEAQKATEEQAPKTAAAEDKAAQVRAAAAQKLALGLLATAAAALKAANDLQKSQQGLEFVARNANIAEADLSKAMVRIREDSIALGHGQLQATDAMRRLIAATGDLAIAERDMATAMDLAAARMVPLEKATDAIIKARQGDVAALKDLNIITKEQEEALASITDVSERARLAQLALSESTSGAASAAREHQTATAMLAAKLTEWWERAIEFADTFNRAAANAVNETTTFFKQLTVVTLELVGAKDTAFALRDSMRETADEMERAAGGSKTFAQDLARSAERSKFLATDWSKDEFLMNINGFLTEDQKRKAADAAKRAADERRREQDELDKYETRAAERLVEIDELHAHLDIMSQINDARAMDVFARSQQRIAAEETVAAFEKEKKAIEDSNKAVDVHNAKLLAMSSGMADAVGSIGSSLASLDDSGKASAYFTAIDASVKAALAVAMAATPPPVGGPHYIPGAIKLTAAAAFAFAKAGRPMTGAGGGGVAAPPKAPDRTPEAMGSTHARPQSGPVSDTRVFNIYSTFGPSPQQARELVDTLDMEMRNRTRGR